MSKQLSVRPPRNNDTHNSDSTADGTDFMGERLTVQFARGSRQRDALASTDRTAPRPRRTPHRMQISGLPGETSWQVCPSNFFVWIIRSQILLFGPQLP